MQNALMGYEAENLLRCHCVLVFFIMYRPCYMVFSIAQIQTPYNILPILISSVAKIHFLILGDAQNLAVCTDYETRHLVQGDNLKPFTQPS